MQKYIVSELYLFLCFTAYDDQTYRVRAIHALVHKLPDKNKAMLDILTNHLLKYVYINTFNLFLCHMKYMLIVCLSVCV